MSKWYFSVDGQAQGPVEESVIVENLKTGRLTLVDLVFKAGDEKWRTCGEYDQFKEVYGVGSQLPPQPALEPKEAEAHLQWVLLQQVGEGGDAHFRQSGPFSTEQINDLLQVGKASYSDYLWRSGFKRWARVGNLPEFDRRQTDGDAIAEIFPTPDQEPDLPHVIKLSREELLGSVQRQASKVIPETRREVRPVEADGPDLTGLDDEATDRLNLAATEEVTDRIERPIEMDDEKTVVNQDWMEHKGTSLTSQTTETSEFNKADFSIEDDVDDEDDDEITQPSIRAESMRASRAPEVPSHRATESQPLRTADDLKDLVPPVGDIANQDKPAQSAKKSKKAVEDADPFGATRVSPRPPEKVSHSQVDVQPAYWEEVDVISLPPEGSPPLELELTEEDPQLPRQRSRWLRWGAAGLTLGVLGVAISYAPIGDWKESLTSAVASVKEKVAAAVARDDAATSAESEEAEVVAAPPAPEVPTPPKESRSIAKAPAPAPSSTPVAAAAPAPPAAAVPPEPAKPEAQPTAPPVAKQDPALARFALAPAGKTTVLNLKPLKLSAPDAMMVIETNAPVGEKIAVSIRGRTGEILQMTSFTRNLTLTRSRGEVPVLELAPLRLPAGTYKFEAAAGSVRRSLSVFIGRKDRAFLKELDQHLKMISYQQQSEKKAIFYTARRLEAMARGLGESFNKLKGEPARWRPYYNEWQQDLKKVDARLAVNFSSSSLNSFAYPEELSALRQARNKLAEQAQSLDSAIVQKRDVASKGGLTITKEFTRLKNLASQLSARR